LSKRLSAGRPPRSGSLDSSLTAERDKPRFGRLRPSWIVALALAAGALTIALSLPGILRGTSDSWAYAALSSGLSVKCYALIALSGLGCILLGAMFLRGRGGAVRRGGQDGTAILEFALVLPIALALVLVMAQSSLLLGGNVCVHYSAYCGARSAVVTVPAEFPGEAPNTVAGDRGAKFQRIRQAVVWALLPTACGSRDYPAAVDAGILAGGVQEFFSNQGAEAPGWASDTALLSRRLSYAADERYTVVRLEPPSGGYQYGPHEDLTVRVRHTYYLTVPYAAWLFAAVLDAPNGVDLDFGAGERGLNIYASCTLTNQGERDYIK